MEAVGSSSEYPQVEALFQRALDLAPYQRAGFLEQECPRQLRGEVETLIAHYEAASGSYLSSLLSGALPREIYSLSLRQVGHYEIVREIARGGSGVVYMARQVNPRREIALKVLRFDSPSSQSLRRFHLEAEALGQLNHPGIAHIYEAGMAAAIPSAGECQEIPFVAMELIDGPRLCDFAVERRLSVGDRLVLLAQVADALHHAHQKGIIHRDLKPANILVTQSVAKWQCGNMESDGASQLFNASTIPSSPPAQPKIVDFGVARFAGSSSSDSLNHTRSGELLGTLAYMSPEQLTGDTRAVDIRSDIYSLGVVGFELLTGETPISVRSMPLPLAIRALAEMDTPLASTRNRALAADIDAILAKAMEKAPGRRYESAAEFAADIRRYLRNEPVLARPPKLTDQLSKFARRNRGLVSSAVAAGFALLAGTIGTATFAWREREQAERARAAAAQTAAVSAFLMETLGSADPHAGFGRERTVRDALDAAAARLDTGSPEMAPEVQAELRRTIGETYSNLGHYTQARVQLEQALTLFAARQPPGAADVISTQGLLAAALDGMGDFPNANLIYQEALSDAYKLDRQRAMTLAARLHNDYGVCLGRQQRFSECLEHHRKALAFRKSSPETRPDELAQSLAAVGTGLMYSSAFAEAEPFLRDALALRRQHLPSDHPHLASNLTTLSSVLRNLGKLDDAAPILFEALKINRTTLDPDHPNLAQCLNDLGVLMVQRNRPGEAVQLMREALFIRSARLDPYHPDVATAHANLAFALGQCGLADEARRENELALEGFRRTFGPRSINFAATLHNIAIGVGDRGDPAAAGELLSEAYDIVLTELGEEHETSASIANSLAIMWIKLERTAEALSLLEQVLVARQRRLGENHYKVALTRSALAHGLLQLGDFSGAMDAAQAAIPIFRADGGEPPRLAGVLQDWVEAKLQAGEDWRSCETELRAAIDEAVQVRRATSGETAWPLADALRVQGLLARASNRETDAQAAFHSALHILDGLQSGTDPQPAQVRRKIRDAFPD